MVHEPPEEPYSILRQSGPDGHARIKLKGLMFTSSDRFSNDSAHLEPPVSFRAVSDMGMPCHG